MVCGTATGIEGESQKATNERTVKCFICAAPSKRYYTLGVAEGIKWTINAVSIGDMLGQTR